LVIKRVLDALFGSVADVSEFYLESKVGTRSDNDVHSSGVVA